MSEVSTHTRNLALQHAIQLATIQRCPPETAQELVASAEEIRKFMERE